LFGQDYIATDNTTLRSVQTSTVMYIHTYSLGPHAQNDILLLVTSEVPAYVCLRSDGEYDMV